MKQVLTIAVLALAFWGCADDSADSNPDGGGAGGVGGGAGGGGAGGVGGGAGGGGAGGVGGGAGGVGGGAGGVGGQAPVDILPGPPAVEAPAAIDGDVGVDTTRSADCDQRFNWTAATRGWIIDEAGNPLAAAKAQTCVYTEPGTMLLCLRPDDSGADGVFTTNVPMEARCNSGVNMRVLLPSTGRASMYCDANPMDPILRLHDPLVLFQTVPARVIPPYDPGGEARDVVFADGTSLLGVVPDNYYGSDYDGLGMRRIAPDARGLCFLEGAPPAAALVAFYPEGNLADPVDFKLPNDLGLAAGSQVTLSVLGSLECTLGDGGHVPEAAWEDFGTGTVSADGAFIESDPGSGMPCINWIGYRPM